MVPRIALIATLLATLPLHAAPGFVFRSVDGVTVKVSKGRIRASDSEGAFIIDTVKRKLVIVDFINRRYASGGIATLCKTVDDWKKRTALAASRKFLEMNNVIFVPSNTRDTIVKAGETVYFDESDRGIEVVPKGKSQSIGGYPTKRYVLKQEGWPVMDIWLATDPALATLVKTIDSEFIRQMEKCGIGPTAIDYEWIGYENRVEQSNQYTDLISKGWVMKRRDRQSNVVVHELESGRPAEIDPLVFQPPGDFSKIPVTVMVDFLIQEVVLQGEDEDE
ncbi:MAG: hypothetical protein AAF654_07540 [Myxococcota bacterium]